MKSATASSSNPIDLEPLHVSPNTATSDQGSQEHFDVPDPLSPTLLTESLSSSLQRGLTFLQQGDQIAERAKLFAAYIDDVAALEERRKEVLSLIKTMELTGVEMNVGDHLAAEAEAAYQRTVQKAFSVAIDRPLNHASADLAALPIDELRERFRNSLRQACTSLAQQVVRAMDFLVDSKVVGLVHWPSQNAVKYNFYRRRIYSDAPHTDLHRIRVERRSDDEAPDDVRRWKRVSERLESTNFICVLEHHKHEAVDAFQTSIENSKVVMPEGVRQLIRSIPEWMRPSIRVLDGYLIGEKVHFTETCREKLVRTSVVEEPLHGHEPAVTLGPYVLVGWGPREIDAALAAEQITINVQRDRESRSFWGGCALGTQFLAAVFARGAANHTLVFMLTVVIFLASVPMLALALRSYLRSRGHEIPELRFQQILFGLLLCAAAMQLFWLPGGAITIFGGIILGISGVALLRPHYDTLFSKASV